MNPTVDPMVEVVDTLQRVVTERDQAKAEIERLEAELDHEKRARLECVNGLASAHTQAAAMREALEAFKAADDETNPSARAIMRSISRRKRDAALATDAGKPPLAVVEALRAVYNDCSVEAGDAGEINVNVMGTLWDHLGNTMEALDATGEPT